MPNPDINRELCLALNLWKEGEKCSGSYHQNPLFNSRPCCPLCNSRKQPFPDPPDLLSDSGFVLLLGALLAREEV